MKAWTALLLTLCLTSFSFAEEPVPVPGKDVDSGGWQYWLVRTVVFDIDALLKEQGIAPRSCTYKNINPAESVSYQGIGPCLYENFSRSMSQDSLTGTTYTWIQDSKENYYPIEIRWRPARGGWMSFIKQALEMKFEGAYYKVRKFFGGASYVEELPYNEFLLGDLDISLPDSPEAMETLVASGNTWVAKYAKQVKEIKFGMTPQSIQEGKVIYKGHLNLGLRGPQPNDVANVDIISNINVLVLDRKFFTKAHVELGGGVKEVQP